MAFVNDNLGFLRPHTLSLVTVKDNEENMSFGISYFMQHLIMENNRKLKKPISMARNFSIRPMGFWEQFMILLYSRNFYWRIGNSSWSYVQANKNLKCSCLTTFMCMKAPKALLLSTMIAEKLESCTSIIGKSYNNA